MVFKMWNDLAKAGVKLIRGQEKVRSHQTLRDLWNFFKWEIIIGRCLAKRNLIPSNYYSQGTVPLYKKDTNKRIDTLNFWYIMTQYNPNSIRLVNRYSVNVMTSLLTKLTFYSSFMSICLVHLLVTAFISRYTALLSSALYFSRFEHFCRQKHSKCNRAFNAGSRILREWEFTFKLVWQILNKLAPTIFLRTYFYTSILSSCVIT